MFEKMMKTIKVISSCIMAVCTTAGFIAFIVERFQEKKEGHTPYGIYEEYIKRPIDVFLSTAALMIMSPLLAVLTITGAIKMEGDPFFIQERPGKDEKIFKIIKFRSMNSKKDANGNLLPDIQRITRYGDFLRKSSLDELPELINIVKGDMSFIGPRPLLVKYLPLYNSEQKHRHDVRPGLTGLAQIHGRNCSSWEERFSLDVSYVRRITLARDVEILIDTVLAVLKRDGIYSEATSKFTMTEFTGEE